MDNIANKTRIALGCGLAVLSAVLLTFSFAPYNAWFLVWVGFVPMAVAQHRVFPSRFSRLAPALSIGGFIAGCFGGAFPPSAAWYMKALPLLVGATLLLSPGERPHHQQTGYARWPLHAAVTWVALEFVRLFVPVLGTWGFIGYAMYQQTWFLQPVAVVGMFGLDLLILLTNYAAAMLVIAWLDGRRIEKAVPTISLSSATRWCAGVLVLIAAWSISSLAMRARGGEILRVAALQPGRHGSEPGSTPESRDRSWLAVLSEQTRRASSQGARVIVWPEAALSLDPALYHRDELASLAREVGAYLFIAYRVVTPAGQRNEVLTVSPKGAFLGRYGKAHPVLFVGETSLSRGTYPTYETAFGKLGAMICADIDFTDSARALARGGAQVIAVPSADWPAIARTHFVNAVFRALETGTAVVKSEYSRDSVIVDGSGAIVASAITPQGSKTVLVADVSLHSGLPLAARFGDWVGWLCAGGLVVRTLARRRATVLFKGRK